MAYADERKLDLGERNPTQIVARIDLDESYDSSIRYVTWSCYLVDSDTGDKTLIKELTRTIENKAGEEAYVFANLTTDTLYYITAVISNINYGNYGDVLYYGSQRTAIAGGTIYPTEELAIISFEAHKRSGAGLYFTVNFSVSGLTSGDAGLVRLTVKRIDGEGTKSSWEWDATSNTLTETIMGSVKPCGVYAFTLVANIIYNDSDEIQSITQTTTVVFADWQTNCQIVYDYQEAKELTYDDGRIKVTVNEYIDISAANWKLFCESINALRANYDLEEVTFIDGRTLSSVMWNTAMEAFYEFAQLNGYSFNIDAYTVSRGGVVSKQLIDDVNDNILQILAQATESA